MSLHYRLFGLPCVFCGRPVERLDVYEAGVRTVHEPGYEPPCEFISIPKLRTGGAVERPRPPAPAPASSVRSIRSAA